MHDLNDRYYFAVLVEHGGFAAAERAAGIPKSPLTRRISQLESELGVRRLQRSTRGFAVTDVGTHVYRNAQTMLEEAQAARDAVDRLSATPRGVVRVSVPVSLAQQEIPALLPDFLALYPGVRLQFFVSNRRVDPINEGIDVALRVRTRLADHRELVLRTFGSLQTLLAAGPRYRQGMGRPPSPDEPEERITVSTGEDETHQCWGLRGPGDEVRQVPPRPRVAGSDSRWRRTLARRGAGIALLPETMCAEA